MKKFLTLFTALLFFGSMMVVQATTHKIYIEDQTGWSDGRALYAWPDDPLGGWPGLTTYTSEVIDDVNYLVFEIDDAVFAKNLIFNNNNNGSQINLSSELQTRDYYFNVTSSAVTQVAGETYHLYLNDQTGWGESLWIYAWGDREVFGNWDNQKKSPDGTEVIDAVSYKVYNMPLYKNETSPTFHLIISNAGADDGTRKLFDITEARDYYLNVTASDISEEGAPAVSHTYTAAGDNITVFGTAWAETLTDNDMADQGDGTWLLEKTDLALSAGTVHFKVCQDHSWTNAWPASDYSLSIPADGIYTITITFTESTTSIAAEATKTGDAVVIPTIAIHSNITNPEWEASANFVSTDGNITASLTLNDVAAGNYKFGMLIAGVWASNGSVAFTRSDASHVVEADEGNFTFAADQDGNYTFTWTYASNTLEITYPTLITKTVYINDLTGWEEVALYAYDSNNDPVIGNWPGLLSGETEEIESKTYIKYEIPASLFPCSIIFNNNDNGEQTADYYLATAQDYYLVAEQGILHDKDEVIETYHLYVRNLTTWDEFDVYAWGDKDYFGAWGGKTAPDNTTTIDGIIYNIYDFEAVAGSTISMNLIFHNGVTDSEDPNYHRHTHDATEARDYYFTVSNDGIWEGLSGVKRFRACLPLEHVYGYQFDEYGTVGTEWPGAELTPDAEGWYEFVITKGRTVIFNNGTGEGAMQTGDLAYTDGDPVADEVAVWQGATNVAGEPAKTYMVTSDDPDAICTTTYERNVTNGNYGTICLPYEAVSVTGATLFSIAGKNDNGIFIDEETTLLKGVPYIFLASADRIVVRYWEGQDFTPSGDNLYSNNGLVGYINDGEEYTVVPNANNFILYNNGLWWVNSVVKLASNRAFIDWSQVPDHTPAPAPGRKRCAIGVHNMPTAIDQITNDQPMTNKVILNGHLYIINNGVMYNAQGIIVK